MSIRKDRYTRRVVNIGYLGEGQHKATNENKAYVFWKNMIHRCYSDNTQLRQPTYYGCSVVEEWHNLQVFCDWYYLNYIEDFVIDKDLLIKGNKIYGPDTCCFIPQEINNLLTDSKYVRGEYPIGVRKQSKRFQAYISINKKVTIIGTFDTIEEAFENYCIHKEKRIKEVANKWKDKLKIDVYEKILQYKKLITD
jgi:hypothetical protein